jgi:hypothetical protein
VAPAAAATSVVEQLAISEPLKTVSAPVASTPTGMGARSAPPGRGRGRGPIGARVGIVPPNLLSVGVVETHRPAPEPVTAESVPDLPLTGEDALAEPEAKARGTRKRAASDEARPRRARKSAATTGEEGDKPATKRARKSRSKSASE